MCYNPTWNGGDLSQSRITGEDVLAFVSLREGEEPEAMLKRFQTSMQRSGILRELRNRRFFRSKGEQEPTWTSSGACDASDGDGAARSRGQNPRNSSLFQLPQPLHVANPDDVSRADSRLFERPDYPHTLQAVVELYFCCPVIWIHHRG